MSEISTRKTRAKGRETAEALLDAAIAVIAEGGLQALSHRSVAAKAGVAPALTTYHFGGRNALISAAFDHYERRGAPRIGAVWEAAFSLLGEPNPDLVDRLSKLAVEYLFAGAAQPEGTAFELAFLLEPRLPIEIAERMEAYRATIRTPAIRFCEAAGSSAPETDATLLIGLVTRVELELLNRTCSPQKDDIEAQFKRILGMILS